MADRCDYSDLDPRACAHCTGTTEPRYSHQALAGLASPPDQRTGHPIGREMGGGRLFAPTDVTMPGWGQPCTKCGALAGDAYLCPMCVEQFEVDCANAPMILDELEVTITRLDRVYRPAPPPDAEASETMPYSVVASAAHGELRGALVAAAQAVLVRLGRQWEGDDSPPTVANWLGRNSQTVALHPDGDHIARQVQDAVRKALRAIDTLPERVLAGPCPTCGSRLMAYKDSPTVRCDTCAKWHQVTNVRAAMMDRFDGELYTISGLVTIAQTMGYSVRKKSIEDMARRGRITPAGVSSDGWNTYNATDLLTVLEERSTA